MKIYKLKSFIWFRKMESAISICFSYRQSKWRTNWRIIFLLYSKRNTKKKPVNVYEIPNKFNLDENEYVEFVKIIYDQIKELRNEFRETGLDPLWSNLTMSIEDLTFKVEYNYDDSIE